MDINVLKEIKEFDKTVGKNLYKKSKQPKHISLTELSIINYLMVTPNPIYQKDIVDVTKLKKSSIAEQLDRMEEKGIIKRVPDKNDKRKNQIVLTKSMLNKKQKMIDELAAINKKLIKNISKKDLETFINVLNKMKRNINN